MDKTARVLSRIHQDFVPSRKNTSSVELGTSYRDGALEIVVGVSFEHIEEARKRLNEEYEQSGVSIVVRKEAMPTLKTLEHDVKSWWTCW